MSLASCSHCEAQNGALSRCRVGQNVGGKYAIMRHLGQGGMGVVYEATHRNLGRRFAIKFLHDHLLAREELLARFHREAMAASSLENEHIVAVTDFETAEDGTPYLVMEYLDGADLARVLAREGALREKRALRLILQVCDGLQVCHARGIVHRDLKPQNLFVVRAGTPRESVKILDFGVAKLLSGAAGASTESGVAIGTAHYMSPEQARGDRAIDARADVYALGTIFYELLSGRKLHVGHNPAAVLFNLLTAPPVPLESVCPNLSSRLCAVIRSAIAFEPEDRYRNAAELGHALRSQVQAPGFAPVRTLSRASSSRGTPGRFPAPVDTHTVRARRARKPLSVAAGILALSAGLGISLIWTASDREATKRSPAAPRLVATASKDARALSLVASATVSASNFAARIASAPSSGAAGIRPTEAALQPTLRPWPSRAASRASTPTPTRSSERARFTPTPMPTPLAPADREALYAP